MSGISSNDELPIPGFYDPQKVGEIWRVPYETRAREADQWSQQNNLPPAALDDFKVCLLCVDVQNTFCIPGFELFVGGRSGKGAVDDNRRLISFLYRNLHKITQVSVTMDTHQAMQIFHAVFLVNAEGDHPEPMTLVSVEDILSGRWQFNPAIAPSLHTTPEYGQAHLLHYTQQLAESGKYDLTIWPYHAMLGGIGHALVPAFEEATFFHTIARQSQADFILKGNNALTESYSVIGPEVLLDPTGKQIAQRSDKIFEKVRSFDALLIAGQAKSHCVAWTISDLLEDIQANQPELASKVYLLEDCASPVVVPGVVDYTEAADAAYQRFEQAGIHRVRSTDPMPTWPGMGAH